jgi:type IV pilus assembly protein PilB
MRPMPNLTVREALVTVGLLPGPGAAQGTERGAAGREGSFVEVLRRLNTEPSYQNLMDVLNFPIWGKSRKEEEDVRKALLEMADVTDEDLREALDSEPPSRKPLEVLLLERGLVDPKALEKVLQRQRGSGMELWRALVTYDVVRPQQLGQHLFQKQAQRRVRQVESRIVEMLDVMGVLATRKRGSGVAARPEQGPLQALLESGALLRDEVLAVLQPYQKLVLASVDLDKRPPLDVIFTLPVSLCRKLQVLPLEKQGQRMTVGLVDPRSSDQLPDLEQTSGCVLQPVLISKVVFEREMERLSHPPGEAPQRDLKGLILASRGAGALSQEGPSPAVQLTKSILEGALSARATDVHLEPQKGEMRVRFRIDGRLYDVMEVPRDLEPEVLARIKILADMDIAEKRRPQDGHFSIAFGGKDYNMRVSTLPTYTGEKLALRILDESNVIRGVSHLGMEDEDRLRFEELIRRPYGMILATGPIGSGKSTTLYSAMGVLNTSDSNIVTIEDPVEVQLQGVNQVQVDPDIGVTFASGLRAILRQDADILMVGEIRDPETARVAAWAAMTGQLVLCTLHTNDAISALTMLVNFGVERFVVAGAVAGVVAQRLVRRLCPDCKEPYAVPPALAAQLGLADEGPLQFYRPKGCNYCFQTGFHGRTGVHELLLISERLREMILERTSEVELRKAAMEEGMRTLRQNGLRKVLEGKTTLEEVMREIAM